MNLFNRNKTFRPLKSHDEDLDGSSGNGGGGGSGGGGLGPGPGGGGADGEGLHTVGRRSQLSAYAKHTLCTLGATDMRSAVMLPEGESLNEWLAVNTVDFFNELSMLYGAIGEYCTATSCPIMTGGDTVQYLWADGAKFKKPVECSAPQYVDYLMTWVESQLNDDTVFPISSSGAYPKKFQSQILPTIYKRFFRVYAHIYHSHFMRIQALGADAHLNTCFKHFVYFVEHFKLVDAKEMVPLQPIIEKMKEQDGLHVSQHQAAVQLASGSVGGAGSSGGHAKHQQLALGPSTRALVADPYALGADEDDDDGSSGADASSTVL